MPFVVRYLDIDANLLYFIAKNDTILKKPTQSGRISTEEKFANTSHPPDECTEQRLEGVDGKRIKLSERKGQ